MSRIISVEKMSRYLGNHQRLSQDDKISLAKHCMALHKDGLKYGEENDGLHVILKRCLSCFPFRQTPTLDLKFCCYIY